MDMIKKKCNTFYDVTHQNIPRNRTGVVAEILCVAGYM